MRMRIVKESTNTTGVHGIFILVQLGHGWNNNIFLHRRTGPLFLQIAQIYFFCTLVLVDENKKEQDTDSINWIIIWTFRWSWFNMFLYEKHSLNIMLEQIGMLGYNSSYVCLMSFQHCSTWSKTNHKIRYGPQQGVFLFLSSCVQSDKNTNLQ